MGAYARIAATCILGTLMPPGAVLAAELIILTNQGATPGVRELAVAFERASGHKVIVIQEEGAALEQRINTGPADLVTGNPPAIEALVKNGRVVASTVTPFVLAGLGLSVRAGAPKPDISTVEGFKQAMLKAKSIGHSQNGTGPYNTKLFQRLGIYEQVKHKVVLSKGRPVATYVASGEVEIGIQQTNVIQPFPGTEYLGPLPAELIEYGHFSLGVSARSKNQEAARAFIAFATSPAAAPFIRKSTMEPPAR